MVNINRCDKAFKLFPELYFQARYEGKSKLYEAEKEVSLNKTESFKSLKDSIEGALYSEFQFLDLFHYLMF